jgi:soluble lytic murein transglycosylase-like protein
MKQAIYASIFVAAATPALAYQDESNAAYWTKEWNRWNQSTAVTAASNLSADKEKVKKVVERQARQQLGAKWVNVAVRIANTESRFNTRAVGPAVRTRNGTQSARGVMQVLPTSAVALGFNDIARLTRDDEYSVAAGIAHMKACIDSGVTNDVEMSACHVAGVQGWNVKLHRRAEQYKRQYVAMVMR